MTIVKRLVKGSKLTHAELDGNFDHLENNKLNKSVLATNNAVLIKDSGGNIVEVVVEASRIMGRSATGEIRPLTATEVKTLLAIAIADVSGLTAALAALTMKANRVKIQFNTLSSVIIDNDTDLLATNYSEGTAIVRLPTIA